jgi:hypothetical protein
MSESLNLTLLTLIFELTNRPKVVCTIIRPPQIFRWLIPQKIRKNSHYLEDLLYWYVEGLEMHICPFLKTNQKSDNIRNEKKESEESHNLLDCRLSKSLETLPKMLLVLEYAKHIIIQT